ncbi:YdiU family protein [Flammeovirga sp. MY04]|uniref:protein adenylyltransferase SelO n=1 Tax=Flammeovirga sp. MY04 TaxID=1191459 RepID=UPI0008061D7A|nr:YdiU family protein [Flammeovirga sp. MY04]ANQ48894.1 YdiU family protein [Flammeovirga sp. MY04]
MKLKIIDTFTSELPADKEVKNTIRQVENACYSYVTPTKTSSPQLLHVSNEMVEALGINKKDIDSKEFLDIVTGNAVYPNTTPYAMCYGGHQFGQWAGQLGDGRAINLFEVEHDHKNWAVQLKGAGLTPYSRHADGLAVLRSSIREYLCSEAMYHLGIPTTRALSLSLSGDKVLRDVMYDGNSKYEPGAIVSRVAPSFIRFGNFEILAAQQDHATLKQLADYTITHFYPELDINSETIYVDFFREVSKRNLEMVIHWQRVGFVHGVMNTDNMSILGLTIDYGPYGWLEGYDFGWTPNTTDRVNKRYRYGTQGEIVGWNLFKLANALFPLIGEAEGLQDALNEYRDSYDMAYYTMMSEKLGLFEGEHKTLINELNKVLHKTETDMTIFFRQLSDFDPQETKNWLSVIRPAFYDIDEVAEGIYDLWESWFTAYRSKLIDQNMDQKERTEKMNGINPKYVLRNYMAQLAIDDAEKENYELIAELFEVLKHPYDHQKDKEKWYAKRPDWARNKVGCSMLSCSS